MIGLPADTSHETIEPYFPRISIQISRKLLTESVVVCDLRAKAI